MNDISCKRLVCKVYGHGYISHQKEIRKVNAWGITNTTTIVDWVIASNLYILLMDTYLTYLKKILRVNTLWSLLISSVTSTIAITQFTIDEATSPQLSLMVKTAIFTTSVITSLITGYIKVEKIQERIEYIDSTRQKWLNFMLSLTSELQVGAKLRKNAENIIQERRTIFNHLSSKRIEIPHHVQQSVSKFLTTRIRRKNTQDKCSVINTLCCGRMKRKLLDKKYIELTQQNLSIYKMVNKLLEEEVLLLGKVYSETIKNIDFHNLTDLFEYHIETNNIEMRSNKNLLNDDIRSYSPMSSDDEEEQDTHKLEIETPPIDIENIVLDINQAVNDNIELTTMEIQETTNKISDTEDISPSEKFVKSMKEFVDVSMNNSVQD